MKILAFSDVGNWDGFIKLFDNIRPDLTALIGDVSNDGLPDYAIKAVFEYYKIFKTSRVPSISSTDIEKLYSKNESFRTIYNNKKNEHVKQFYKFLHFSGRRCPTLVIRGNHDEEDYLVEKITKIKGCQEISGDIVDINGLNFLGLSYELTHYLSRLKSLIKKNTGKVDVVLVHGENLRLISTLNPLIIIRGGYVSGKYLINNVPSVWTSSNNHAVVDIVNREVEILHSGPEVPIIFRYNWIKPYSSPNR
jgi:hypothetical protein